MPKFIREPILTTWIKATIAHWLSILHPVSDRLAAAWEFWGPRLTDKSMVSMVIINGAAFVGYESSPQMLNAYTLGLWVFANLMFPPWDTLPNSRLRPPTAGQGMASNGLTQ